METLRLFKSRENGVLTPHEPVPPLQRLASWSQFCLIVLCSSCMAATRAVALEHVDCGRSEFR